MFRYKYFWKEILNDRWIHITYIFVLLNVTLTVYCIPSDNDAGTITISMATYNPKNDNVQIFDKMIADNSDKTLIIDVINTPGFPAKFFILQVHSFKLNVTLSYNATLQQHFYVNGTNIGLHQNIAVNTNYRFYIHNKNTLPVTFLISAHVYNVIAPVPGGCNMEFCVEISPFQKLIFDDKTIIVDAQPAATPFAMCELPIIHYDMYHMFLSEQDFTADSYFNGIKQMMTVNSILANAKKVPAPITSSHMRRVYSAYHGTGEVFVVVATFMNNTSVYVPVVTYGCSSISWNESCEILTSTFSKLFAAATFFIGLFICYLGHKFFKTEMFLLGFLGGSLITYIMITMIDYQSLEANLWTTAVAGTVAGLIWLIIWCCFGSPMLSVSLAFLILGFLITSIIFYSGVADIEFLQEDVNFWCLFASIVLFFSTLLISIMHKANILACSIIGAYSVIICCDHFIGSNLKYIIINIIRRATSNEFQRAIIDPPYQTSDMVLSLLWAVLIMTGIMIQWYQQKGKPPFPPPPSLRRRNNTTVFYNTNELNPAISTVAAVEHTPLLTDASPSYGGLNQSHGSYGSYNIT